MEAAHLAASSRRHPARYLAADLRWVVNPRRALVYLVVAADTRGRQPQAAARNRVAAVRQAPVRPGGR
jgi:hypothetical protein